MKTGKVEAVWWGGNIVTLALSLRDCATLGKLLNLSEFSFPCLKNWDDNKMCRKSSCEDLSDSKKIKHQAHSRFSINAWLEVRRIDSRCYEEAAKQFFPRICGNWNQEKLVGEGRILVGIRKDLVVIKSCKLAANRLSLALRQVCLAGIVFLQNTS